MLTPEQIQAARQGLGIQVNNPVSTLPKDLSGDALASHYMSINQPQEPQQSGWSKAGELITGGKAGQDIAQAGYTAFQTVKGALGGGNTIDDVQKQAMNNGNTMLDLANKQKDSATKLKYSKMAADEFTRAGNVPESIIGKVRTGEQITGDMVGLLTNLAAGGGAFGGAGKVATSIENPILKAGAEGAIHGAVQGGIFGAGTGASQGLQENGSALDVAGKTALGAGIGTAGGAVIGGAVGATPELMKAGKEAMGDIKLPGAKSPEERAIQAITPKVNDMSKEAKQAALDSGKLTPQGKFSPASVNLTPEEKAVAVKNADLLQGKTAIENYGNVSNKVSQLDEKVGAMLKEKNISYSKDELKTLLKDKTAGISDVLANPKVFGNAKNNLVDSFVDSVKGDKVEDLWKARKSFDRALEERMNAFSGTPTAKKALGSAIRNTVQTFIDDHVGEGVYKGYMKQMTELLNMNDTIGEKALKEMGKSGVQNWFKNNPIAGGTIKKLGGLAKLGGLMEIIK